MPIVIQLTRSEAELLLKILDKWYSQYLYGEGRLVSEEWERITIFYKRMKELLTEYLTAQNQTQTPF